MTDKQIKLDGSFIPIEEAIKAGLVSESKRLDRIDKLEIDLANYEQMERDIEKIIEPYQLHWELDCLSLPSTIQSILERKEQECEELKKEIDIRSCANIELSLEFKKYQKAIDEIEEIADNNYENPEMERIFKIIGGLDV